MEHLLLADTQDGLEQDEEKVEDEDSEWTSVPGTADTDHESGVVEEEEYIGLPSCGGTDQEEEEEEIDEEDEELQILCEGSQNNICSAPLNYEGHYSVFVQGRCHIMMPWLV